MSAADPATTAWRKGIQDVSREAAGAVGVVILMQSELPGLLANALLGDPESIRLLQLTAQLLTCIEAAPKREGMLCACCPRPDQTAGRLQHWAGHPSAGRCSIRSRHRNLH